MQQLPITSLSALYLAMLMLPLALSVTMRRIKLGNVVFGDAEDEALRRRIRAHGNFTEYVPLSLIVLGLAELREAPVYMLWGVAFVLVTGRTIHALASLVVPYAGTPRGIGMLMTHAAYLVPALWLLFDLVMVR